ncbi:L,D-transpeptidase [Breoghania sp. L-A4]|uniref:L,D-transpeptidase n=1 Tax=Breoghania sp. L-A4 TaxID=2304600 RepID=UPI000E35AA60|nr:L,D-transpeptidase [Breoghania sp. L-A4]AXS42777.1 L,D-transpeptidase [Breoghania sp. L-A4]
MRRLVPLILLAFAVCMAPGSSLAQQLRFDPSSKTWMKTYIPQHVAAKLARKKYKRDQIDYSGGEPAGSVVIDTSKRRLYYVMGNGKAMRYGIGVGREGFEWQGTEKITRKAKWPSWTPPAEMRAREAKAGNKIPAFMPGGEKNPLGARAMYIGRTLYRIHGTNEDWSIGRAVSSGCIRMLNDDVIDLYERVKVGAKVVVL